MSTTKESVVVVERIVRSILVLRGQRVLLDSDLAALYGVPTKRFNEQIKRNNKRFPADFMFQLEIEEAGRLRSQFATSNVRRGGRRYAPYVFTEHGAIMAAMVLNSSRAIEVSVQVVRTFVSLREIAASSKELAQRLRELESKLATHDESILSILRALRGLMNPQLAKKRPIGFVDLEEKK